MSLQLTFVRTQILPKEGNRPFAVFSYGAGQKMIMSESFLEEDLAKKIARAGQLHGAAQTENRERVGELLYAKMQLLSAKCAQSSHLENDLN